MKFCPNCGTQIDKNISFCPNCGTHVRSTTVENRVENNHTNNAYPRVENRSIALWIILSFLTCGIAGIIWFISIVNDVNTVCNDEKSSMSGGVVFLLSLLTCGIYAIIFFYQAGLRMEKAGIKYGKSIPDNSVVYLVLSLVGLGIIDYCLLQSDLNKFSN